MVARSRLSFASLWIGATLAVLACSPGIDAQLDEAQALVAAGQPMEALPLLQRVVQHVEEEEAQHVAEHLRLVPLLRVRRLRGFDVAGHRFRPSAL